MTSDDSGLNFQMPGPDPRIGEESCRESGSSKPLEVSFPTFLKGDFSDMAML